MKKKKRETIVLPLPRLTAFAENCVGGGSIEVWPQPRRPNQWNVTTFAREWDFGCYPEEGRNFTGEMHKELARKIFGMPGCAKDAAINTGGSGKWNNASGLTFEGAMLVANTWLKEFERIAPAYDAVIAAYKADLLG